MGLMEIIHSKPSWYPQENCYGDLAKSAASKEIWVTILERKEDKLPSSK